MGSEKALYGLVGYPLKHSLSPLMHNAAFKALKLDAEYQLFQMTAEEIPGFFEGLRSEECPIFGFNVTIPYKETVIPYMDSMTPFAKKANAVNTVVVSNDRKFTAHNTDGPGFLAHWAELGVKTQDKRIAILGAGGAARAIIASLCILEERPESVRIFDVEKEKADALVKDLGERMNVDIAETVDSIEDLNVEISDILINATPIGMKPDHQCLIPETAFHSDMFVYDLIYNPAEPVTLRVAKAHGAKIANGLGMLYYQGVLAFQHWAEIQLNDRLKNIMREALEEGLRLRS